jgi:predicted dehydrogenase/threonine dehydrogenase-like Zn-dependent dehydrogenase
MKQVFQNPKTGKTTVENITPPILKSGFVLVRNHFSAISVGTERSIIELSKKSLLEKAKERPDYVRKFFMLMKTKGFKWAWQVAQSKLGTSIALGYSSAGEVINIGSGVEEFRVGDRVACGGQNYASHAEIISVPKNLCVKVPVGVSDEEASFATIGAIALQGIRQAKLTPGENVAVIGLGLLGQLAIRILRAYGHPVIGFDINEEQLRFAKKHGLDEGVVIGTRRRRGYGGQEDNFEKKVSKFTNGKGVDVVLIYAAAKTDEPLKIAVAISRKRGRIVQIGNILTNIPWRDFYPKELAYIASNSYGPGRYDLQYEEGGQDYPYAYVRWTEKRNMEEVLRLLAVGDLNLKDLINRVFPIEEAERAYQFILAPRGLIHGVLISYPQEKKIENIIKLPRQLKKYQILDKKIIKVGLIGLGSFMKSEILPHLKKCRDVKVKAIAHSRGLESKSTGEEWGAEYLTNDYRELLADKDIDLIICATRHSSHAKIAQEVLEAGKNLYIEKPLALNEEELEAVMKSAHKTKGRLFVGFNRRFSYHFREAKKEFADSATPLQILYRVNVPLEEHWSHDPKEGGRLIGEGCHFVDAIQFLAGSKAKRVFAGGVPVSGAIRHEENFSFIVECQNGSLGVIFYSGLGDFRLPKEYIEIYGSGKIMVIDNFQNGQVISGGKIKKINLRHQHKGYLEELELLLEALRDGKSFPISLEELRHSHLTTFKIAEALKSGRVVELNYE